jgi:hypothetical protein
MTSTLAPPTDLQFLANYLINARVYGVVIPPDASGSEFFATFEVQGDQGTLTMAAIIGPRGPQGQDAFLLNLVNDAIDDPADLPETLQNTKADIGKTWLFDDVDGSGDIIGASAYIWYGAAYRRMMLGSPGPPGPIPIITPDITLLPPGQESYIDVTSTNPAYPQWMLYLSAPAGPQGPAPAIALSPDVDLVTNPPTPLSLLGFTGRYTLAGALSPPPSLALVPQVAGGTIPAGTYVGCVTATNAAGETVASATQTVVTTGTGSSVEFFWGFVQGATGYKLYWGPSPSVTHMVATIGNGQTTSYQYTGATGAAGTPPGTGGAATPARPIWVPVNVSQVIGGPFSMPESAFTSFSGISQRAAIGSFAIPPQPFPWTPICWGHLGAFGLELSADPLKIGAEIRLGDPTTGQLVSRGFGNTLGEVNFMPHWSDPNNPGLAITPTNGVAVCPANHTSAAQGTIYTNLYNDGTIGLYQFSPTDAQIFVMITPVASSSLAVAGTGPGTRRR